MEVTQSREGTRRADISYKEGVSSRPVTNNKYSELPDPTEASSSGVVATSTTGESGTETSSKGGIMI